MSAAAGYFLETCGATGTLLLEWNDPSSGATVRKPFPGPALLVGRNPKADIVLDHPDVGMRHAYLQLIEGRLYAVDLGSRAGLTWGGIRRASGWVDRRRPVDVGPVTLRAIGGGNPEPAAGPTSDRFQSRQSLPSVFLEVRHPGEPIRRCPMDRGLVLVGGSERCQVRLRDAEASRFACALVRTPEGVWAVDLLSSKGFTLNGMTCRASALLEDGDAVRFGGAIVRILYGDHAGVRREPVASGVVAARPAADSGGSDADASGAWSPAIVLRPLLEQALSGAGSERASSPFGEALVMLVGLLGDVHRDHLSFVREELAQVRRLRLELEAERPGQHGPTPRGPAFSPPETPDFLPLNRPGPQTVQSIVGERLAAWDRSQQSRWRKVLAVLAGVV